MLRVALILLVPAALAADVSRGADIFARNCAIGYCHGSEGSAGRAPRIQGRSFERSYLLKVTREGVPGTAMPAWKGRLAETEIQAVVAYMLSISAGPVEPSGAVEPEPPASSVVSRAPVEAMRGKALFFDATRGTRCGTCHSLEDLGTAIGPNLAGKTPRSAAEIREPPVPGVRMARLKDGEAFPALPAGEDDGLVRVFDLTVPPPALRTVPASEITLQEGSRWRHASFIAGYSDSELEDIIAYLRWLNTM